MVPSTSRAPAGAAQQPHTSTTTLWAKPSKQWVIPAKPKPGRKPKAVEPSSSGQGKDSEANDGERKVQNRAAQRAFRERKQSQLAELQAKLQQYEQGEIQRNVALQNIAKRLKDENEHLQKENLRLTERVSLCEKEHSPATVLKRRLDHANLALSEHPNKRIKTTAQRLISSDTSESPITHSYSYDSPLSTSESSFGDTDYVSEMDYCQDQADPNGTFSATGCGLCSPDGGCFCRDIGLRQNKPLGPIETVSMNKDPLHSQKLQDADTVISLQTSAGISILDNLPAFQPPVPIRRRVTPSKINSVFPVSAPTKEQVPIASTSPMCSGDPANCLACADDTFGQAFCAAIGESVASTPPCENCPCQLDIAPSHGSSTVVPCGRPPLSPSAQHPASGTITTDVAWRQIKSHPNVEFNDLSLLADVVARRSKCKGPRVVISPPLGAATPERVRSPPVAHKGAQEPRSPPRLVPQEVLIECGRKRVREVRADAVKEALQLLDSKFSRSN